ncbi:cyclic nucleotide-binding domain protein [Leptospira broomii serovar Hurstbridge str. 5399]|uniref:Cyclic nucleotide-binding domain protein n=1 Tax=Leptospira broomii serovar Hurstbridge str. 5399 TaxID=1049789 RepID=T0F645_9LEPT|nr:Crp/Fnr family transcriptional regulator [Leptospira broomii]EQA43401.1 cyclic nucleotide-binding domain protein [Leptospira broomii serovar Hurstbridge str. 5399]
MASALAYQVTEERTPLSAIWSTFPACSKDLYESLLHPRFGKRTFKFPKKSILFNEGKPTTGFYLVLQGTVRTFKDSPNGQRQQTLKIYSPESWVGLRDAISEDYYNKTAECLEDTVAVYIDKEEMKNAFNQDFSFQSAITKYIATECRAAENRIYSMGTRQVHSKLAEFLLSLKEKYGSEINVKFSREVMATMIGSKTETLVRALTDLKGKGWIEIDKNMISIRNEEALLKLMET